MSTHFYKTHLPYSPTFETDPLFGGMYGLVYRSLFDLGYSICNTHPMDEVMARFRESPAPKKILHITKFWYTFIKNLKTMGRNTSISLGDHFENFVDKKVSTGRFKNVSEVIRAGLRLLEEEEIKIIDLRKAINEGFESGFVKNFNPKQHLEKLKFAKRKNG